jgi:hypothetical protein
MIESSQVRRVAETHLRLTLAVVPSAVTALLNPILFDRWVALMTVRCRELDRIGCIPSGWALNRFIEDGVVAYARVQLEKMGQHSEALTAFQ